jgi:hypothetical protein
MAVNNKNPHGRFYGLLSRIPGVDKEELIWQYSDMLTYSLTEFLKKKPGKYARMITDMQKIADSFTADKEKEELLQEKKIKKLRSAILVRLQKYGIDTTNWTEVNNFMRQPKIAGKTLGEMNLNELYELIPKLESILTKARIKKNHLNFLADNN